MAPLRHLSAILLSDRISSTWACTRSIQKERRVLRKQLPRCAGSGVLQSSAALCGRPGGARDGALLATRLACAWPRGATDAGAIREAYIKRNKHDAADAEAICEAVQRPTMRFVPVKMAEQQAAVLLHRGREQLVRQRTMLVMRCGHIWRSSG
jgi:hypothetical protein